MSFVEQYVNRYIDSLYEGMNDSDEVKELKDEMRIHLLETIRELKAEGKSEEESIKVAIQRFGEIRTLQSDLVDVFSDHRKFARYLFRFAMTALAIWFCCFIGVFVFEKYDQVQNNNQYLMEEKLMGMLNGTDQLTPDIKKQAIQFVEKNASKVSGITIYETDWKSVLTRNFPDKMKTVYSYQAKKQRDLTYSDYMGNIELRTVDGEKIDTTIWTTTNENGDIIEQKPSPKDEAKIFKGPYYVLEVQQYDTSWTLYDPYLYIMIGFGAFVMYWLLFSIWAMVRAYNDQCLTTVWAFAFCLLNVFAYILYRSVQKRHLRNQTKGIST